MASSDDLAAGDALFSQILNPQKTKQPTTPTTTAPIHPDQAAGDALLTGILKQATPEKPASVPLVEQYPDTNELGLQGRYEKDGSFVPQPMNPVVNNLVHGAVRGFRDVTDPLVSGAAYVNDKTVGSDLIPAQETVQANNKTAREEFDKNYGNSTAANIGRIGGQLVTTAPLMAVGGGLAGAVASRALPEAATTFLSGSGGANLLGRTASRATQGALQGGEYGALTTGKSDDSIGKQALEGAAGGAVLTPAVGAVSDAAKTLSGKAATLAPKVADLFQYAKSKGIDLPATTVPDAMPLSNKLAYGTTKVIPGSGAGNEVTPALNQWHKALADEVGVPTGKLADAQKVLTPPNLNNARANIQSGISDIEQKTPFQISPELDAKLRQMQKNADVNMSPDKAQIVRQQIQEVRDAGTLPSSSAGQDTIPVGRRIANPEDVSQPAPKSYHDVVGEGSAIDAGTKSTDPLVAQSAKNISDLVRGDLTKSPDYSAALAKRDNIDALISSTDKNGKVDPIALANKTAGKGDNLDQLSQIGKFLTPQKSFTQKAADLVQYHSGLPAAAADIIAAGGAHAIAGLGPHTLIGAIPTQLAARAAGNYYRSPSYVNNLLSTPERSSVGKSPILGAAGVGGVEEIPTMTIKPDKKKKN